MRKALATEILHSASLQPFAHCEIKLKQNTDTARSSFRLVSTCEQITLMRLKQVWNCFRLLQCFVSVLFPNVRRPECRLSVPDRRLPEQWLIRHYTRQSLMVSTAVTRFMDPSNNSVLSRTNRGRHRRLADDSFIEYRATASDYRPIRP